MFDFLFPFLQKTIISVITLAALLSNGSISLVEKVRSLPYVSEIRIFTQDTEVRLAVPFNENKNEEEIKKTGIEDVISAEKDTSPSETTSAPKKIAALPKQILPETTKAPVASTPIISATPAPASTIQPSENLRNSIVNIYCNQQIGNSVTSFTGSGVIIDEKGVILTNSHIAQYVLLKSVLDCVIRTGNPARSAYKADVLYMPESWINKNYNNIIDNNAVGTGEGDYALLYITEAVSGGSLPASFPAVGLETATDPKVGDQIHLVAYPASFLGGATIANSLYITSALSTVKEVLTFVSETIDLMSTGGNVLAQKGSSGGGVFNADNKLIGLIVTTSDGETTGERDLRAITMTYINRDLINATGKNLASCLAGDLETIASQYASTRQQYEKKLIDALLSNQ